jgi:hypothetical protein
MTNKTQVSLHEAGNALRQAVAVYAAIEKRLHTTGTTLSAISRQARAAKIRTDQAFYESAEASQTVLSLTTAIADYDGASEKALQELNLAGNELDNAVLLDGSSGYNDSATLNRCAKQFSIAQTALNKLQTNKAKERRKSDAIALRQAEADYAEKVNTYDELKLASDALEAAAAEQEKDWNLIRFVRLQQSATIARCQSDLRSAACAYASMSSAQ